MFFPIYRTSNSRFVLFLLCGMVHSGIAFAPELVVHDLLDSTAFNVAMFAMGWAATRWASTVKLHKGKGNDPLLCLDWVKAMAILPLGLLPPRSPPPTLLGKVAPEAGDSCATPEVSMETPLLAAEQEDSDVLLAGINSLLTARASSADASALPPWRRSCFHGREESQMQLLEYLSNIHWFFECSNPCLVIAMIYLDRVLSSGSKLALCPATCRRLFLTSLLVAVKFHDDDYSPYPNALYANIGNVDVEDLNAMEKQFCKSIDWHFYVRLEEYVYYHDLIVTAAPTTSADSSGRAAQLGANC